MNYCERCGENNQPKARFCGNCATALPSPEQERLQPGYGYNIHTANCDHGLKIMPMNTREKLALLGSKKYIFVINLSLILCMCVLLMFPIFKTDNPLWKEFLEQKVGLFGPDGQIFTAAYFLLLCVSLLFAGSPLFTRNTYNAGQLLPTIILECVLFPIAGVCVWQNLYFGNYLGTTLTAGGYILLTVSVLCLILQWILIREYKKLKKSGIYSYVAN